MKDRLKAYSPGGAKAIVVYDAAAISFILIYLSMT